MRVLIAAPELAVRRGSSSARPQLRVVTTPSDLAARGRRRLPVRRSPPATSRFLQYTSGSTGDPKGVVLTHANLLAKLRAVRAECCARRGDDVCVSWLPLYHDMGLIGAWLGQPLFGMPLVVMSPLTLPGAAASTGCGRSIAHRGTHLGRTQLRLRAVPAQVEDRQIEGLDLELLARVP